MPFYDYLIVGSGLFGAVFAHEATKAGKRCLVIDKRTHTGGNIHCKLVNGITVHQYGAHIFHTSDKEAWDYVNALTPFHTFINSPLANFGGELYHLPFNMDTFYKLWGTKTPAEAQARIAEERGEYAQLEPKNLEEQAMKLCGRTIYERLIKGYTEKQWGRSATELPPSIIKRVPLRFTYNNNYFNDLYQGIPTYGYNALIDALLDGVEVRTDCDFFARREELTAQARNVLFTGCIDEFYGYRLGRLDYRSLRFEEVDMPGVADFQGNAVVNYTERNVPYTRIIEHKHFACATTGEANLPDTFITREYPDTFQPGKEPYYPINDERNSQLYAQYKALADSEPNTYFGGRLATYTYADMDDTIIAALALSRKLLS